jgi:energy-coupling factor transport system ATP-binding protein
MVLNTGQLSLSISQQPVFSGLSFSLDSGETALVSGPSGSGKTALGLTVCGFARYLSPQAVATGRLELFGTPVVQGEYRRETGIILEDPHAQTSGLKRTVAGELAFPLECRGVVPVTIRERVGHMLSLMEMETLAGRDIVTLSGGELQRLVIGASLIADPRFLFLDRPITELDTDFRKRFPGIVSDHIRAQEGAALLAEDPWLLPASGFFRTISLASADVDIIECKMPEPVQLPTPGEETAFAVNELCFGYSGGSPLFDGFSLNIPRGGVCLIEGPNGSGKTTLAKLAAGILVPDAGRIMIEGHDTATMKPEERMSLAGFAPQQASTVFCRKTVREEISLGEQWGNDPGALVSLLGLNRVMDRHPLELTKAMQKRLAVALAYGPNRRIVFLDEPSHYQDNAGFSMLVRTIVRIAEGGTAVAVISHDPRFGDIMPDVRIIRLVRGGNG